jgi:NTE family protein
MERSLLMAINGNTQKSKEACHILIEPPGLAAFSGFEISKARKIFDLGYEEALKIAPKIYKDISETPTP